MANVTTKAILNDGPRNAIVKFEGILDTSDVSITPALSLSELTSNDGNLVLTGLRLDEFNYSISSVDISVELQWQATAPQSIMVMQGQGKIRNLYGSGLVPNRAAAGYNGNINLITRGFLAGTQIYTIVARFVKLYG